MTNILRLIGVTVTCLVMMSCASNRAQEIGDPTLTSPAMKDHYQTIYDAFSRYDTNGDGFLDEHEFNQLQSDPKITAIRNSIPELANSPPMLFNEVDEDGDGRISVNELTVITQPFVQKNP